MGERYRDAGGVSERHECDAIAGLSLVLFRVRSFLSLSPTLFPLLGFAGGTPPTAGRGCR